MESLSEQLSEILKTTTVSEYSRESVVRLAQLASSEDLQIAKSATRAFFTGLVERLADSFEAESVSLYNRIFARFVETCRNQPAGLAIDLELSRFGLEDEDDLVARAESLRQVRP